MDHRGITEIRAKLTKRFVDSLEPGPKVLQVHDTELPGFVLRIKPTGRRTWLLGYRNRDGRRLNFKLGNYPGVSPDGARELAKAAAGDIAKGIDVQAEKKDARLESARQRASTLRAFIKDRYSPWALAHLKSGVFQVDRLESDFAKWLDKPMSDLNSWLIEGWRNEHKKAEANPRTINRKLQRLRACVAKAVEWKILREHPFASVKPLKTDKGGIVRYLTADEEASLRAALEKRETDLRAARARTNEWREKRHKASLPARQEAFIDYVRPIVMLAINTGLRRGEIFNLKWRDIDLAGKLVTVQGGGAKSGQTRRVPLNAEALETMTAWKAQTGEATSGAFVFPGEGGARLGRIDKAWDTVIELAKITDFRFHDLRHHFASRLVQGGVDLNLVRELLGHADLAMVLRYAHLAPENLAAAVEKVARTAAAPTETAQQVAG